MLLPSRVLLDKGLVRRVYEAQARQGQGIWPTLDQLDAVQVFVQLLRNHSRLYLTEESAHVLQLRRSQYAAAILNNTTTLQKGTYLRRWARRLRAFVFTREDAVILAYGSFGVDPETPELGVDVIATTDLKLATNFNTKYPEIKEQFDRMVVNLPEPYRNSSLPEVVTPTMVLSQ